MSLIFKYKFLTRAVICSLALMIFSFFIHFKFPVKLISVASLLLAAWILSRNIRSLSDMRDLFSNPNSHRMNLIYAGLGISFGVLFAVLYRWHLEESLFPATVKAFVLVAALIGTTEELVFRGIIQDYVKSVNVTFSILFSTLAHTGYKCCLFLSPVVASNGNIGFLAFWTFMAGIILGTVRQISRSILPSILAHALFDILVYAEFVSAPWWVW